ncbi:hypothetical protein HU200_037480 [Digitaria exilis]|uniref:NAC domain-containing protein n=1 Tax=Digitaria exilis TaxID=1010633 RepID=A0A835BED7_9POAL|nr:hypothetical protein HU200_037480 [Digitaria exilis]CAB3453363.1 unnamed protein product [Digitaria exilis]
MGAGGDGRLPPGFRFRPTDEELLTHYLAPKAADPFFTPAAAIREVDLYTAEPWDLLPPGRCWEEEDDDDRSNGGYFFCRRSVRFPSGLRTNRATRAGYWKSTGRDKVVRRHHGGGHGDALGVKKTLVFYLGRAPTGRKTNWVMHEYRLVMPGHRCNSSPGTQLCQSEWVICRMFMKKSPGEKSQLLEQETTLHPPLDDHLLPSVDGCDDRNAGGKAPSPEAAATSDSGAENANCFSSNIALAMAQQGGNGIESMLQLNHEALLMNFASVSSSDHASAPAASPEATLLRDELATDSFDFLPQLLDYEAFPFVIQDF